MKRARPTLPTILLIAACSAWMSACRQSDRYAIQLRDLNSQAPIEDARITTRYQLMDEVFRPLRWGKPRTHYARTDADGRAEIRVEPGHAYWFAVDVANRPLHAVHFDVDGGLNESLGKTECRDGWISLRPRPFGQQGVAGSMEMSVAQVKKAQ